MLNWIVRNRTICIKMDLTLNNLQCLMCHKTKPNKTLTTVEMQSVYSTAPADWAFIFWLQVIFFFIILFFFFYLAFLLVYLYHCLDFKSSSPLFIRSYWLIVFKGILHMYCLSFFDSLDAIFILLKTLVNNHFPQRTSRLANKTLSSFHPRKWDKQKH